MQLVQFAPRIGKNFMLRELLFKSQVKNNITAAHLRHVATSITLKRLVQFATRSGADFVLRELLLKSQVKNKITAAH